MILLKALIDRYWPHLLIIITIGLGVWFLDHRGYERAKQEQALEEARAAAQASELRRQIEQALNERLNRIDHALAERIDAIDRRHRTHLTPIIEREIRNDPRLTDPAAGLSDSVRSALNTARRGDDSAAAEQPRRPMPAGQ